MKIVFHKFQESHLPLFRSWLAQPHVQPYWQETSDLQEKFFCKYPEMGITAEIITVESKPIGFIQSYEACRMGAGWWPDAKPGTFGVDLFIGEPEFHAKGWGPKILLQYLRQLIQEKKVHDFIIDPEPTNPRAIAAYEKVGFRKQNVIETPNGKAQLMTLSAQDFLNPEFSLKRLDETWISRLQQLFESAPQYNLKVEGRLPSPTAARDAITSGPPNFDLTQKYGFGFFRGPLLVGYIDIANGYPEKEIAYLGLLLIDESLHGLGFGKRAFELLQTEIRQWSSQKIRLSVAQSNDVLGFWKKMGFTKTGRILRPQQEEIICNVIEMEKTI